MFIDNRIAPSFPPSIDLKSSCFVISLLFIALFWLGGDSTPFAFSQAVQPGKVNDLTEAKNRQAKSNDRPDLRDRWMMRGRTAPPGLSAATLRLRAHQQKMVMRARVQARTGIPGNKLETSSEGGSGTPWVALGPAPLISDQNIYGPVAGRATAVAIDPSDATGNTVYVAAATGGVWKSTNAAETIATNVSWAALTDQQASLVNGAVSVKSDGSVVLVGTGEPDSAIDSYYGVGVLRSTDHGATWTLIPTATGNNPALSFAGLGFAKFAWDTSPATTVVGATATTTKGFDEGDISDTTNRGLYYSNDSGQTWTFEVPQDAGVAITPASMSATDVVYDAVARQFIAVIRYHGLYSSPNGMNWTRIANQPAPLSVANCPAAAAITCPIYRGQLAVVKGRDEVYFWFVSLDSSGDVIDEGIWRSVSGGTWSQIDETGITNCGDPGNNGCGVDQGYYNLEITAIPNNETTDLYAGAVNLFKCELSSGTTCLTLDPNLPSQWINLTHVYGCYSIASVHPDEHGMDSIKVGSNEVMYFANDGGIYRTLDGFTKLNSGTCGTTNGFDDLNASSVANGTIGSLTQFVSFSVHPSDQTTLLGGTQDNGSPGTSSAIGNPEWTTVNGGDGGFNAINPDTPTQWYTANSFVNIYLCSSGIDCTTDMFSLAVGSGEVGGDTGAFYTPYILDPQNSSEMLVGTCRVWRGEPTVPPRSFTAISVDFDTLAPATCTGEEINLVSGLAEGGPITDGFSTVVYAATEGTGPNASAPSGGEVWVTTNAGTAPMVNVTGAINPSNYTISSVAMDASDATGATAYFGIMGFGVSHVFKTADAGGSGQLSDWADWSGSGSNVLPDAPVNALLVDSSVTPSQIYAGTDVGLFVSSTTSASWTEVGNPSLPGGGAGYLPNVPVTAIRIFNSGGTKKLRVSTYGRGIWEYALATSPDYTNVISNSPQTIYAGQTATFTGTLTPIDGYASSVNLSCTGTMPTTCTLNPTQRTPPATYTLTAAGAAEDYNFNAHAVGTDPNSITHDAAVTLHIVDFNLTAPSPNSLPVPQGGTSSAATFQVTAAGSFSGTVNLSCSSGLPAGATCQFSPASAVMPTASNPITVTMTVTAATNTPVGGPTAVTLAATVSGAPVPKTQTFSLTVTPPAPDFALTVTATPTASVVGQTITWNGTLKSLHGYTSSVNLSCTGVAPGTCTLNPSSLVPTTSGASFTVTVGNSALANFNFSIQGTDGTLTHTQAVSLAVGTDVNWIDTGSTSVTVEAGQSATYSFSAAPVGGSTFSGAVTFACADLPAQTTCNFSPSSLAAGAGTTAVMLTITTVGPASGTELRKRELNHKTSAESRKPPSLPKAAAMKIALTSGLVLPLIGLLLIGIRKPGLAPGPEATLFIAVVLCLALLVACGGLGGGGSGGVVVAVTPSTVTVPVGAPPASQQQFSATVINGSTQTVTWGVNGAGTINSAGLYTAPATMPNSSTVTVTATSALATAPGTANVTLTGPTVTVAISPTAANLFANEPGNAWPASATQQQFSATVINGSSQNVTWAVTGGNANGSIDENGLYTSPAVTPTPASVTVTATSTQASSPGTANVTIQKPTAIGTFSNIQVVATAAGGTSHADGISLTVD